MARAATWGVVVVALGVVTVAGVWPYPLDQGDQGKQAQYVLDCVVNHHLLVPRELGTLPATKPPLYTWLAAACSWAAGGVSLHTVQLPALASGLALALLLFALARRLLPEPAAVAAAIAFTSCHHFVRIASFIRTDGLLTLWLTAQLYLYVRTWNRKRPSGATVALMALASAAAWLTKGPIGGLSSVVIALHLLLRRRSREVIPLAVVPAVAGAAALGAWFAAAVAAGGDAVYDTMVVGELGRHAMGHGLTNPLYYLGTTAVRITPWQLLLPAAVWVGWRAARGGGGWRRLAPERSLLLVWLAVWLVALSLIAHQRPDLFFPAEPALFLLLGLAAQTQRGRPYLVALALLLAAGGIAVAAGLAGGALPEHAPRWVGSVAGLCLVAGGAIAWHWRRAGLAAAFAAIGAAAVANLLFAFVGSGPAHAATSFAAFGARVRVEAHTRGARIVAVGVRAPSPLFHLRLAELPVAVASLGCLATPLVVVCPQEQVAVVTGALAGCEPIATSGPAEEDSVRDLVALACGGQQSPPLREKR